MFRMFRNIMEKKVGDDLVLIDRIAQNICVLNDSGGEIWRLLVDLDGDFTTMKESVLIEPENQKDFDEFCNGLESFLGGKAEYPGPSLHSYFFEAGVPLTVALEITEDCQLRCRHCYNTVRGDGDRNGSPNQLSLHEIERLADDISAMGTPFVIITGGEPLRHPQIMEICTALRSRNLAVKLFTNGWTLTPEIAKRLGEMRVYLAGFTLFGREAEQHEFISRTPGSFERIIKAIKLCRANDIVVNVTLFLMRHNFEDRQRMAEWAGKELGVEPMFSFSVTPKETGSLAPFELEITPTQLEIFLRELDIYIKQLMCGGESLTPCTAGKTLIAIKANGDVVPCISLLHPVGNIKKQTFEEIWRESTELKKFRDLRLNDITGCSTCPMAGNCLRCFVNASLLGGNLFGKDPRACRISELLQVITQG